MESVSSDAMNKRMLPRSDYLANSLAKLVCLSGHLGAAGLHSYRFEYAVGEKRLVTWSANIANVRVC
jgi:hypothetical protein